MNEPQGTSTRRAGSFAGKIGCVMKHLRRIRDDGVRRRQARRWLNIAGDGDGDDDEDDGDDDGDDDDDEGNGVGDDDGDDDDDEDVIVYVGRTIGRMQSDDLVKLLLLRRR